MTLLPRITLLLVLTPALPGMAIDKQSGRQARADYEQAVSLLQEKRTLEAVVLLDQAIKLDPENRDYLTTRELARQQAVAERVSSGERLLAEGASERAAFEFRQALSLDPQNPLAADRLRSVTTSLAPRSGVPWQMQYRDIPEIVLAPQDVSKEFHYRGDVRGLLEQVWRAYGVAAIVDSSVSGGAVRFDIEAIDFARATDLVQKITKTFYVTLSPRQVIILADTPENRKQYERLAMRTFYLSEAASPQDLNDLSNLLRQVFNITFASVDQAQKAITVRAPLDALELATRMLQDLNAGRPQLLLDVHVYEVDRTFTRNLGFALPLQFTLFNFNTAIGALLQNPSTQDLINQLIASGGINQANIAGIAALLGALSNQNSIVNQGFALFGGGITRSGLVVPPGTLNLSLNESYVTTLEHVTLRAAEGDPATFRVGTRFPILNATFSPISTSPALNQVILNQSFQAPFPSFNYEDLGLTLKATPRIHGMQDVTLQLEFQIRGLGAQQFNGVPVLTNREYKGTVTLVNGETAVLAGSVSELEQRSLTGVPGLVKVPVARELTSTTTKQVDTNEILVTITPNIIQTSMRNPAASVSFAPPAKQ